MTTDSERVEALRDARECLRLREHGPPHIKYSTIETLVASLSPIPAQQEEVTEALKPFASFAENFVDSEGWNECGLSTKDERIVDWFGPSDFRNARTAMRSAALRGDD